MRRFVVALTIVALLAATGLAVVSYTGLISGECHLYTVSIGLRFPEGSAEPDWQPATALTGISVKADNLETDLMGHHLVLQKIQGGYLAVLDEGTEMTAIEAEEGGIVDVAVACQKILFPGNRQESILAKYIEGQWWTFQP